MAFDENTEDIMNEEDGFEFVKNVMGQTTQDEEVVDDVENDNADDEINDEEMGVPEDETPGDEVAEGIVKGEEAAEDENKELTIADVDSDLVESARKRGWGDDRIVKYASEDPQVLQDIHSLMQFSLRSPQQTEQNANKDTDKEEQKVDKIEYSSDQIKKLNDAYGDGYYETVIKPIVDSHNSMAERVAQTDSVIGQFKEDKTVEQQRMDEQTFNDYLDEQSKSFPSLGQWKNIPLLPDGRADVNSEVVKERVKLWSTAKAFRNTGMSMHQATKEALDWYKGKTQERNVEKKVVQDLNKRKKKFTPRPTNKKVKKKFSSPKEEGMDLVREAIKSVVPE